MLCDRKSIFFVIFCDCDPGPLRPQLVFVDAPDLFSGRSHENARGPFLCATLAVLAMAAWYLTRPERGVAGRNLPADRQCYGCDGVR